MPNYRLYRLDGAGRISAADWIEAADDTAALSVARAQCGVGSFELWDKNRLVHRERSDGA